MGELESRIEQCESDLAALDEELVKPEVYSDGEAMRELTRQRESVVEVQRPLEMEWERRAGEDSN
jgi:protein subunit release factor A